ncbi:MAG: NAD(P)H-dependent oxidoreductase [bacterium]|nr:NAD(P)H-dependent oxidoreductase [bacterium]
MDKKNVLVLLGHTDKETTSGGFADAYEEGARAAGFEVRRKNLGDLSFDPILHHGYKVIQELEPDLCSLQEDFRWADHIAIFYPNWWGTMPAMLKGLFDRFYLPGFAFRFNKDRPGWEKLLKGRTGRVVICMDSPPMLSRILFGDNSNEIRSAILGFGGIKAKVTKVGPLKNAAPEWKEGWRKKLYRMGTRAK